MPRLPAVKSKKVISVLKKAGFRISHQTGSHVILDKPFHPLIITVPSHKRDLKKGTLRRIIKDAGLTVERFNKLLKEL